MLDSSQRVEPFPVGGQSYTTITGNSTEAYRKVENSMTLRARRPEVSTGAQPQQAAPQQAYQTPPQQGYQVPPQQAYQAPPQQAYQAPPQQEYQAPPQQEYQAPPQQPVYEAPPQQPVYPNTAAPPAQTYAAPPAVAKPSVVADLNVGILENIDDMGTGGNYVTLDGESFLYKDTNETAPSIDMIVASGKRYYQWVDESDPNNKVYHDSDTKLDNRYKLKFEIRWYEDVDGEPTEYIMSLGTTSAIQFINYVQGLAKQGKGVGGVVTRMTISRHKKKDGNDRYSRVDFAYVGDAQ